MSDGDVLLISTTFPDEETALAVVARLVEERLVACGQCLRAPIQSQYLWEGRPCDEPEVLVLLKTLSSRWDAVVARLGELHPYSVPEILGCPALSSPPYRSWMGEVLGGQGDG